MLAHRELNILVFALQITLARRVIAPGHFLGIEPVRLRQRLAISFALIVRFSEGLNSTET